MPIIFAKQQTQPDVTEDGTFCHAWAQIQLLSSKPVVRSSPKGPLSAWLIQKLNIDILNQNTSELTMSSSCLCSAGNSNSKTLKKIHNQMKNAPVISTLVTGLSSSLNLKLRRYDNPEPQNTISHVVLNVRCDSYDIRINLARRTTVVTTIS